MVVNLAWRLFRHEARRGELGIILAAIILSVASVSSLSMFSEKLQGALNQRSAAFLAADRVLYSRQQAPDAWLEQARQMGLSQTQQIYTRSMLFAGDKLALAEVRAADSGFPLRGAIKISDQPFAPGRPTATLPGPSQAWAESRLFQHLGVSIGERIELGNQSFTLTAVLAEVPDAGFGVFNADPKILIRHQDIQATGVLGPGSRKTHGYFFRGDDETLDAYYRWLKPQLDRELHSWASIEQEDSPIGRAVGRASRYFMLASLLAIVLAAVAIAVAAQRYSQRHYDPVAIFKTLGASGATVRGVYLLQVSFITLLGIAIGLVLGILIQQGVLSLMAQRLGDIPASASWRPYWLAAGTGGLCALLFSLYPLLKLFKVPPLRVLRRDMESGLSSAMLQYAAAAIAIFSMMWMFSGDAQMSGILFVGGAVLVITLVFATMGLIWLGHRFASGRISAWQLAWARIKRRAMDNSVQLISFAMTLLLLLVVLVLRNDMIAQWRSQLPEGMANYFVSNIAEADRGPMEAHFKANGVEPNRFYPVVRGRLVAINDDKIRTEVGKEDPDQERQERRGLGREANLTWSTSLQRGNKITAGHWFASQTDSGVSVGSQIAERLDIALGDTLTFNIGSEVIKAEVTSLREIDWQTMQPNFFFVLSPNTLKGFPTTFITSFHLPNEQKQRIAGLMAPFASVTLFDVDARINQLRSIVDQVSMAVEFILALVLIAGALVLIAQVQASMEERQRELAILRTLGAKGRLIRGSVILEFVIIGLVAGLMAALGNEVTLYLLQTRVFSMEASLHWQYWALAPLAGALLVGLLGALSCRRLLQLNTAMVLRQAL